MRSVISHLSPDDPFRKYKALRSATSNLITNLRKRRWLIFPVEEGYYKMSHLNLPCSCLEPAIPKGSPETDLTSLLGGLTGIICPAGASYLSIFLAQSTVELQQREDELSSPGLEQPEVTSMQWVCVSAKTLFTCVCCSAKLSKVGFFKWVWNVCKYLEGEQRKL